MQVYALLFILCAGLWAGEAVETVTSAPVDLNKVVELRQWLNIPGTRNAAGMLVVATTRLEIGTAVSAPIKLPLWLARTLRPAEFARLNAEQQAAVTRIADATKAWSAVKQTFVAAEARVTAAEQNIANVERQIKAIQESAAKRNVQLKSSDVKSFDARMRAAHLAHTEASTARNELGKTEASELNRLARELDAVWLAVITQLQDKPIYYSSIELEAAGNAARAALKQPVPMPAEASK